MKKTSVRIVSLLCALTLAFAMAAPAFAAKSGATVASGKVLYTPPGGDSHTACFSWTLDSAGVMTLAPTKNSNGATYMIWPPKASEQKELKDRVRRIVIKPGVKAIIAQAFGGCINLTSVEIPDSVEEIRALAFENTGLTSVSIPASVRVIGEGAFSAYRQKVEYNYSPYSPAMKSITVAADNPNYSSFEGALYNKARTELVCYPTAKAGHVTLPDSVTAIAPSAFGGCEQITGLTWPAGLRSIESFPPYMQELETIELPDCLEKLDMGQFPKLKELNLPDTLTYCRVQFCPNLTSLTIPAGVTSLDWIACANNAGLEEVTVKGDLTELGLYAFCGDPKLRDIWFEGHAPSPDKIDANAFGYVNSDYDGRITATVHYPQGDSTWDAVIGKNYGGILTWEPWDPSASDTPDVPDEPVPEQTIEARWEEERGHRYAYDTNGKQILGDGNDSVVVTADGDIYANKNIYYLNPERDAANPDTCYLVTNYIRHRPNDGGLTFYDADGISFYGWMHAEGGGMRFQTRLENIPGVDPYCIFVWHAQYLPSVQHPDHPGDPAYFLPAGWYLFDDNGVRITADGEYDYKYDVDQQMHHYTVKDGMIVAIDGVAVA